MSEFLKLVLFSFYEHNFTVANLLVAVLLLLIIIAFRLLIIAHFSRKMISRRILRFIRSITGWLSFVAFFSIVIGLMGLPVRRVLDYVLFKSGDKLSITVQNLFVAIFIFLFLRILVFVIEYWMEERILAQKLDKGRGKSLMQIVKYLIWMIGILLIFSSLGFHVTIVIASISALLVGIGFGLQHIFNDIFSGVIILFDGSIEVDDVVELDGIVGRVKEIGIRASKILTRDNVVMIIPNSKFTSDKVINWTNNDESTRFNVEVGVAYGSDVRLVEQILLECAAGHQQIETEPAPFVRFQNFGDSSLDFQLFFWTKSDFRVENIKSDLRFDIDARFRSNKIEIPFPQRDVHIKQK